MSYTHVSCKDSLAGGARRGLVVIAISGLLISGATLLAGMPAQAAGASRCALIDAQSRPSAISMVEGPGVSPVVESAAGVRPHFDDAGMAPTVDTAPGVMAGMETDSALGSSAVSPLDGADAGDCGSEVGSPVAPPTWEAAPAAGSTPHEAVPSDAPASGSWAENPDTLSGQ